MKLPSCPRALIINILRKNPDGLTLTSIAELAGLHRHTATKYVYELKGAGIINERDVGSCKLCYLREGFSRLEEKRLIGRLNGGGWKKSSTGQVQLVTILLFLFLIPATVIIAQNATQSSNSAGELILEQNDLPEGTPSTEPIQTIEIQNTSVVSGEDTASTPYQANVTVADDNQNQENSTLAEEIQNQTTTEFQDQENISEQDIPTDENTTAENITISDETILNKSDASIPESINESSNNTMDESQYANISLPESQSNITIPELKHPILNVKIISPDRTLRGESFGISAAVTNTGNSNAKNVRLEWKIPPQFEMVSGDSSPKCGTVSPNSDCMSSVTLSSPMSAEPGKNEIKVLVKYEE